MAGCIIKVGHPCIILDAIYAILS